ncbi:hypothetical protein D3C72_2167730 [compost metagenome]
MLVTVVFITPHIPFVTITPITPDNIPIIADSHKKIFLISFLLAPIALSIPISEILSITEM